MSDNTSDINTTGSTDNPIETSQAQEQSKTYTQKEFDDHMARMKASVTNKLTKQLEGLGDLEELKRLKTESDQRRQEEQVKRGEFEKILQDMAQKKDAEISKRDQIIREYTVDLPLVNAAAQFRSVNPEQVKALLKPNVRLNEGGEVEIVDKTGSVRYNDSGQPFRVEDLVKEFLDTNPHFVQPTPATTQGKTNIGQSREKLDVSKLDMKNPEHRKLYKEYQAQNKR